MRSESHDRVDGELLRRYRESGDTAAFERLFLRLAPRIAALARGLRVPEADREDFVQDVFLSVLSRLDRIDEQRSLSAWTSGIARRKALSNRRRYLQRLLPPGALARHDVPTPVDELERHELRSTVAQSISRLPPSYREVVELYFVERLRADEIARRLDHPPSTIRTRIARGLERLRALLPLGVAPALLPWILGHRPGERTCLGAARARRLVVGGIVAGAALIGAGSLWIAGEGSPAPATLEARAVLAADAPRARFDEPPALRERTALVPPQVAPRAQEAQLAEIATSVARSARLRVRFVDALTGAPVPDLVFACQRWSPSFETSLDELIDGFQGGRADAFGEAVLDDVPVGRIRLRLTAAEGSRVIEIDGDAEHRVAVDRVASVAGVVFDERGAPIADAEIWTDDVVYGSFAWAFRAARTQADGSFRLAYAVGSPKRLWAQVPGVSRSSAAVVKLIPPSTDQVELRLEPAIARVVGRVVGPDGRPVDGALVTLLAPAALPATRIAVQRVADAEGRFELDTLPAAAQYRLLAVADESVAYGTVDLAREVDASCELVLARGATVRGLALPGTIVGALPLEPVTGRWELWRTATADARGDFALEGVLPGRVELLAIDPTSSAVLARETVSLATAETFEWSPEPSGGPPAQKHGLRRFLAWRQAPGERFVFPPGTRSDRRDPRQAADPAPTSTRAR